eukprot:11382346-Alexandrium_andersonii.AAC.1
MIGRGGQGPNGSAPVPRRAVWANGRLPLSRRRGGRRRAPQQMELTPVARTATPRPVANAVGVAAAA